jgi:hypothetical protein
LTVNAGKPLIDFLLLSQNLLPLAVKPPAFVGMKVAKSKSDAFSKGLGIAMPQSVVFFKP